MDPISIATGALAIIEVTGATTKKLIELRDSYNRLDKELASLVTIVTNLGNTLKNVRNCVIEQEAFFLRSSGVPRQNVTDLFQDLRACFGQAEELNEFLRIMIEELRGDPNSKPTFRRMEKFIRVIRRARREDEMNDLQSRIDKCQSAIEISLKALNVITAQALEQSTQEIVTQSQTIINDNTNDQLSRMKFELSTMIAQFGEDLSKNLAAAAKVSGGNEFFEVSQSVTPFFTGREDLLAELKDAFHVNEVEYTNPLQLRFVVSGVAGSGKSQFCLRFAAEVQQNFWGVFFVDAYSPETAENDFAKIASCGQHGATSMKAAMQWLASRKAPWLLIIDNADSLDNGKDYLPGGVYGRILVTTRDPALQALGNAGKGHYRFEELKHEDAHKLLLRAAEVDTPIEKATLDAAQTIAKHMCYLPLALNFAGTVIRKKLTTWAGYVKWYQKEEKNSAVRRKKGQKAGGLSKGLAELKRYSPETFNNFHALVEEMHRQMTQADETGDWESSQRMRDATDLLKLFAFFHHRNIRLDILLKSIENPVKEERLNAHREGKQDNPRKGARSSLRKWAVDQAELALSKPLSRHLFTPPPVMPLILRDFCSATESAMEDAGTRLRDALRELASRSLISYEGEDGVFSIHPLIHSFCAARLDDADAGLWCEMVQIILARCVVIEEKLFTGGRSDYFDARHLLPHIDHCRRAAEQLRQNMRTKWESRDYFTRLLRWPSICQPPSQDTPPVNDLARWIRFSVVYVKCGKLRIAHQLQRPIRDRSVAVRGSDHNVSILLSLATSITCHFLCDFQESIFLQRDAVDGCTELFGPEHPRTLRYRDNLAMALLAAGRLRESSENARLAYEGLLAHPERGATHRDTLVAMNHYALTKMWYFQHEEALELALGAVDGLRTAGAPETDVLDAQQTTAMAYTRLGGKRLEQACKLQQEVLKKRIQQEGMENPHALLARLQYARVLLEKGDYHEAETMLRWGIGVAIRDLGDLHYGVQAAESTLARVLEGQRKLDEAEKLFIHVNSQLLALRVQNQHDHVDRIGHLWYFMEFYEAQGRFDKAIEINKELTEAVERVDDSYTSEQLGKRHPMHARLLERLCRLEKALEEQQSKVTPVLSSVDAEQTLRRRKILDQAIDVKSANAHEDSVSSGRSSLASPPPAYAGHHFSRQNSLEKVEEKPMPFRRTRTDPVLAMDRSPPDDTLKRA